MGGAVPPLACLLLWKRCTSAAAISGTVAVVFHHVGCCKPPQSRLSRSCHGRASRSHRLGQRGGDRSMDNMMWHRVLVCS